MRAVTLAVSVLGGLAPRSVLMGGVDEVVARRGAESLFRLGLSDWGRGAMFDGSFGENFESLSEELVDSWRG